jgi:hypothetical protein
MDETLAVRESMITPEQSQNTSRLKIVREPWKDFGLCRQCTMHWAKTKLDPRRNVPMGYWPIAGQDFATRWLFVTSTCSRWL